MPAPAPFIKWVGGKRQLLPEILPRLFPTVSQPAVNHQVGGRYFEPFLGGGAVFFALRGQGPLPAQLSDANRELISAYLAVQRQPDALLEALAEHDHHHNGVGLNDDAYRRAYYNRVRALDREPDWSDAELDDPAAQLRHAARFIYLNRSGFNGLWRVNSHGFHNVPIGAYDRPLLANPAVIHAASRALQGAALRHTGYGAALEEVQAGDTVYLDPPYLPLSATASFSSYARDAFGEAEHARLALTALDLARRGAAVLLSNSDTPLSRCPLPVERAAFLETARDVVPDLQHPAELHGLYRSGWQVTGVQATRMVNSRASARGPVGEILVSLGPT